MPAQKRTFPKTCHGYVDCHYNSHRDLVPLYSTSFWVVEITHHICDIISIIFLLCSEFQVRLALIVY